MTDDKITAKARELMALEYEDEEHVTAYDLKIDAIAQAIRDAVAEVVTGAFQRHADCEIGQPCTHIDDRLVMWIAQVLVELTAWHRRNGVVK